MTTMQMNKKAKLYNQVGTHSEILEASPHRIIQLLMEGALGKIAAAQGFMKNKDVANKGRNISLAISIIDGLKMSLDKNVGGEIAENLDALYEYMNNKLFEANTKDDPACLEEVAGLMREIKSGWDSIPADAKQVKQG